MDKAVENWKTGQFLNNKKYWEISPPAMENWVGPSEILHVIPLTSFVFSTRKLLVEKSLDWESEYNFLCYKNKFLNPWIETTQLKIVSTNSGPLPIRGRQISQHCFDFSLGNQPITSKSDRRKVHEPDRANWPFPVKWNNESVHFSTDPKSLIIALNFIDQLITTRQLTVEKSVSQCAPNPSNWFVDWQFFKNVRCLSHGAICASPAAVAMTIGRCWVRCHGYGGVGLGRAGTQTDCTIGPRSRLEPEI